MVGSGLEIEPKEYTPTYKYIFNEYTYTQCTTYYCNVRN